MKQAVSIFLFFIFFLGTSSRRTYAISESECLDFDYRHRMGPVRDQGEDGQCWAFASAALLEEQRCIEDPASCGQSLSPLDTSRCEWTVGKKNQGGLVRYGLNCGLKKGVCSEQQAPYDHRVSMNLDCMESKSSSEKTSLDSQCADPQTYYDYQQFLQQQQLIPRHPIHQCSSSSLSTSINLGASESLNLMEHLQEEDQQHTVEKDDRLPPASLFKKKKLLGPQCTEQRHNFSSQTRRQLRGKEYIFRGGAKNPGKTSSSEKYAALRKIVEKNQRSLSLSVCVNKIPALSTLYGGMDGCSGHAVVANGSRWHQGRCELHIKNSWGEISKNHPASQKLHEWVSADEVLEATFGLEYIGEKKKR